MPYKVDLQPRVAGHHMFERHVQVGNRTAENIHHHGPVLAGTRIAQRPVQHRPQVVLELRGVGTFDAPVSGVVRAHGEFVDDQPSVGVEELDRQHPDDAEFLRDPQRERFSLGTRHTGWFGRATTSTQIPSTCTVRTGG